MAVVVSPPTVRPMTEPRRALTVLGAFLGVMCAAALLLADGEGQRGSLPAMEGQRGVLPPIVRNGNAIFPALEGWFKNADGTTTLVVGYYNRNDSALDIPIGPNNHIDPGGPDLAQPTHFLPRRQYSVFSITVPRDFGNKRLTWTLNAFGQPQTIPLWINPMYVLDPFRNQSDGNTPPRIRFVPAGPEAVAVPRGVARTLQAKVARPLELVVYATDEGMPAGRGPAAAVSMIWSKYRGTGDVRFEPASPPFSNGRAVTTASFSLAGEYWLRAQVNDASGEGGSGQQCCWTNAHVRVNVSD